MENKVILIVSPQSWGTMFLSKHHYALELAKRGNIVYFLNPPEQDKKGKGFIKIEPSGTHPNLLLITHRLSFPFVLKFHALPVFHRLMKFHISSLLKKMGRLPEIVWSFDLNNLYPFRYFPAGVLKIFHPVDEPLNPPAIAAAAGADIIFSVTPEILDKYRAFPVEKQVISHGVTDGFIQQAKDGYTMPEHPHVGFSGNLLRNDIDRRIFLDIIRNNPAVQFDCWGSYAITQTNIGGNQDAAATAFIEEIKQLGNVHLYGAVKPSVLAGEINRADAFLICYDVEKDQSKGTNYHKIMEYLGTGKIIISNNVTAYNAKPELVQMVTERNTNEKLPQLFGKVMADLPAYNSFSLQQLRIAFAADNTYQKQIERIEMAIDSMLAKRKTAAAGAPA